MKTFTVCLCLLFCLALCGFNEPGCGEVKDNKPKIKIEFETWRIFNVDLSTKEKTNQYINEINLCDPLPWRLPTSDECSNGRYIITKLEHFQYDVYYWISDINVNNYNFAIKYTLNSSNEIDMYVSSEKKAKILIINK